MMAPLRALPPYLGHLWLLVLPKNFLSLLALQINSPSDAFEKGCSLQIFTKRKSIAKCKIKHRPPNLKGFPGGSVIKNPPANSGDVGLIPEAGRCPGEGNDNPLQ